MRPVTRGVCPLDGNGDPKTYSKYANARGDLIERLGQYCSYCGQRLGASLAVEHVQPKALYPHLRLEWTNFLLACTNCNSTKGSLDVQMDDYYWPHIDNTFLAFEYSLGGYIATAPALTDSQTTRAEAMIELTGLNKTPENAPAASDRRWLNRSETWDLAVRSKGRLSACDDLSMKELVTELAVAQGFWSVWMTVFHDDTDMLQRLIDAFPGTCTDCFDADCNPIERNPNGL